MPGSGLTLTSSVPGNQYRQASQAEMASHPAPSMGSQESLRIRSTESGWPGYFRILRLYLTHFNGQPCSVIPLLNMTGGNQAEAWSRLTSSLGLAGVAFLLMRKGLWRMLFHPTVLLWGYFGSVHAVIVIQDRYHFPSIPLIAALAAFSLASGWDLVAGGGNAEDNTSEPAAAGKA